MAPLTPVSLVAPVRMPETVKAVPSTSISVSLAKAPLRAAMVMAPFSVTSAVSGAACGTSLVPVTVMRISAVSVRSPSLVV